MRTAATSRQSPEHRNNSKALSTDDLAAYACFYSNLQIDARNDCYCPVRRWRAEDSNIERDLGATGTARPSTPQRIHAYNSVKVLRQHFELINQAGQASNATCTVNLAVCRDGFAENTHSARRATVGYLRLCLVFTFVFAFTLTRLKDAKAA